MPKSEQGFWRDQPASKIKVDFKFKHRWMEPYIPKEKIKVEFKLKRK